MKKMMAGIELSAADATVAEELNTAKMRAYPIKVQKKILKSTRDDMTGRAFFLQI
ncbi:unnamed protein product [Miscanthus lutarioriparius]|uniref:Uncharacterized protein n=1 Tax=Miscanthus lutarioriparius TaxID=422564 RepID=A0A811MIA3_9POAL|nr:unnamed protein product [Miscanthus lutarioriparius]